MRQSESNKECLSVWRSDRIAAEITFLEHSGDAAPLEGDQHTDTGSALFP
jgi:hypothetical protein